MSLMILQLRYAIGNPSCGAKDVKISERVRVDIDVIRGHEFDFNKKFRPDGLSLIDALPFLLSAEMRFLSQVRGRSYANIIGLVERFTSAQILEVSRDHWSANQIAPFRGPLPE